MQELEARLGEELEKSVDQGNRTHLWEQELFQHLQELQTQIEAITGESVPVEVATDQEPTLPPDFVRLPLDEAIVQLYNSVFDLPQVQGNIQPASQETLSQLVINHLRTQPNYSWSRSWGGAFESASENLAQRDGWLGVLEQVKNQVTTGEWESFTGIFRREILTLGVNLPVNDTYLRWLNISEGLPYVRLVNDGSILDLTRTLVGGNWEPGEEIAGYNYQKLPYQKGYNLVSPSLPGRF